MMQLLVTNDAEIIRQVDGLSQSIQKRVLEPVLAQAGKMIADAAAGLVRVQTGLLKRSIGTSGVKTYKHGTSGATMYIAAGPRRGFRRLVKRNRSGTITGFTGRNVARGTADARNPVLYAHLVERGHSGPHPAPAYPFMEPVEQEVSPAIEAMARDRITAGISVELANLSSK
jgi:HK97 gp10 family phage protein